MESKISASVIFTILESHLSARKDFWHIVNGPKRETWFTPESIAALSDASPPDLSSGWAVYGEESFSTLAGKLSDYGYSHNCQTGTSGSNRMADITLIENLGSPPPQFLTIIEAKLIQPETTKSEKVDKDGFDSDDELSGNFKSELLALSSTDREDGLLDQLERASRLFPNAKVFGLVFAVHRLGQCDQAEPDTFFAQTEASISNIYNGTNWELWNHGVKAVQGLQKGNPGGGSFNGEASLGIAIIQKRAKSTRQSCGESEMHDK